MKDQQFQQFQIAAKSTRPDMTLVVHPWPYGRFIEIQSNLRKKKKKKKDQIYDLKFHKTKVCEEDQDAKPLQKAWMCYRSNRPGHIKKP